MSTRDSRQVRGIGTGHSLETLKAAAFRTVEARDSEGLVARQAWSRKLGTLSPEDQRAFRQFVDTQTRQAIIGMNMHLARAWVQIGDQCGDKGRS